MAVYPRFYQSYPEVTVTPGRSASGGSWRCWPGTSWIWASSPGRRGGSGADLRPSPAGGVPAHHAPQPSAGGQGRAAGRAPDGAGHGVPLGPDLLPHLPLLHPAGGHRPLFERAGRKPNLFLETASNRANVSMVQKGLSCSIVPAYYVQGWRTWPASACLPIPPGPCLPATGAIATCPNPPSISSPWPPPISVPSAPRKEKELPQ